MIENSIVGLYYFCEGLFYIVCKWIIFIEVVEGVVFEIEEVEDGWMVYENDWINVNVSDVLGRGEEERDGMIVVLDVVVDDVNEIKRFVDEDIVLLFLCGFVDMLLERLFIEEFFVVEDGDEDVLGVWLLEDLFVVLDGWLLFMVIYL